MKAPSPSTGHGSAAGRARRVASALPLAALLLALVGGALLGHARPAAAAIHACTAADGSTVFQDRPCRRVPPASAARGGSARPPPLRLHPSWFERPAEADSRARCDAEGCRCGAHRRHYGGQLDTAVADALYLDGAWHRYETSLLAWRDARASGAEGRALREALDEAACDILMSQRTLREHAGSVLGELRDRARAAENRGHDAPEACLAGDAEACRLHDAHALYRRLLSDLAALRGPRGGAQ